MWIVSNFFRFTVTGILFICIFCRIAVCGLIFFLFFSFKKRQTLGSFYNCKILIVQGILHIFCPMLHSRTIIDKYICIFQIFDICCCRFPVMWLRSGRNHICNLNFITTNFCRKIIHRIKAGHNFQFFVRRSISSFCCIYGIK